METRAQLFAGGWGTMIGSGSRGGAIRRKGLREDNLASNCQSATLNCGEEEDGVW